MAMRFINVHRNNGGASRLLSTVTLLLLFVALVHAKYAYVTLLYSDDFLLPVRVLGQSIRDTGTRHDLVMLATEHIKEASVQLLKNEGWKVKRIKSILNPNEKHYYFKERLRFAYSKMNIFDQIEYDQICYIDGDMLVVANLDKVFQCGKFCSVIRGAFFNTGFMSLTPNRTLFNELHSKHRSLPSYNGGEQGLMNSYFPDFESCHFFDETPSPDSPCSRLPQGYNGDIGSYFLHDAHFITPPKTIHFTLGPLKPWFWWSYPWFNELSWLWYRSYQKLPQSPRDSEDARHAMVLMFVPAILMIGYVFLIRWSLFHVVLRVAAALIERIQSFCGMPEENAETSKSFMFSSMLSTLVILILSVKTAFGFLSAIEIHPWFGWFLMMEWTLTLVVINFHIYFTVMYYLGLHIRDPTIFARKPVPNFPPALQKEMLTLLAGWSALMVLVVFMMVRPNPVPFGSRVTRITLGPAALAFFMIWAGLRLSCATFAAGRNERRRTSSSQLNAGDETDNRAV